MRFKRVWEISAPRTGSRSVAAAAAMLGFTACHGCQHEHLARDWHHRALLGEWERAEILGVYNWLGQVGEMWYQRLAELFPNDGFVLCERDVESWAARARVRYSQSGSAVSVRRAFKGNDAASFRRVLKRAVMFGTAFWHESWVAAYERHNREAKDFFFFDNGDRFLVFNVFEGDGWDKLASWLDVPLSSEVQSSEFPRLRRGRGKTLLRCDPLRAANNVAK